MLLTIMHLFNYVSNLASNNPVGILNTYPVYDFERKYRYSAVCNAEK